MYQTISRPKSHKKIALPFEANFLKLKIILLVRNPTDVVKSLKKNCGWGSKKSLDYWFKIYKWFLEESKMQNHETVIVRYEDLVNEPKKITKMLFSFIGSEKKEGVETYHKPKKYMWRWGLDDGGAKIKKLKVIKNEKKENQEDQKLVENIKKRQDYNEILEKMGYKIEGKKVIIKRIINNSDSHLLGD